MDWEECLKKNIVKSVKEDKNKIGAMKRIADEKYVLNQSYLGDQFNKVRKIRNAINYYAKELEKKDAKRVISDIKELVKRLKEGYF